MKFPKHRKKNIGEILNIVQIIESKIDMQNHIDLRRVYNVVTMILVKTKTEKPWGRLPSYLLLNSHMLKKEIKPKNAANTFILVKTQTDKPWGQVLSYLLLNSHMLKEYKLKNAVNTFIWSSNIFTLQVSFILIPPV